VTGAVCGDKADRTLFKTAANVKRVALITMMSALCFARVAPAQAPAPPDTTKSDVSGVATVTKYTGGIKGDVTQVSLGHRFSLSLTFPNRITSFTTLSVDESDYRLQDRRDMNKSFVSNIVYPVLPGLAVDGGVSNTRFFNRVITFSNTSQDLKNDVQKAQANAQYTRALGRGLSINSRTSLGISRSEQTFVNDQAGESALGVGVRYGLGDAFDASARGFLRLTSQDAESGGKSFSGLGAQEDSVLASARLALTDSLVVKAEYSRYLSKEDYLELPRGSFGEQQFDQPARPEEQSRDVRDISIDAEAKPVRGLKLTVQAKHTDGATYFAEAKERTSRDVGDAQQGNLTYSHGVKTSLNFDVGNRKTFHWLGEKRTGSYDDKDRRIKFGWNQTLTNTLRFTAQAGASLTQSFYVDTDRDRDQKYQFASVRLNSKLFPKVDASVYVSVSKTDYLNIRASFSQNNRAETVYELRPEFTYKINSRLELTQRYGLNIQFADFVFQDDENYLDRNMSFSNMLRTRLSTKLGADFYYALQRHDKGSYLRPSPSAERILEINQEERRDEVKLSFRYQINRHLALTGLNEYSQRKDLLSPSSSIFKDGGIEVGIDGNYDFGEQRTLKFAMKRVKRFGRFNAEAQNDYWVMDSSINYTF
jgi:hypothetical protein